MPDQDFDCPECGAKDSVWIMATAGGRGTGESTSYGAKCTACECLLADEMPSNCDGKKATAVSEFKRILTNWPEEKTRRARPGVVAAAAPAPRPTRVLELDIARPEAGDAEPDVALLASMATCMNHGFGLLPAAQQRSMLNDMRKVHDEVVGRGYYRPENRENYTRYLSAEIEGGERQSNGMADVFASLLPGTAVLPDGEDVGPPEGPI